MRTEFVVPAAEEALVRERITAALAGAGVWRVIEDGPAELTADEGPLAPAERIPSPAGVTA